MALSHPAEPARAFISATCGHISVAVTGEIDIATANSLVEPIRAAVAAGAASIALDLTDVTFMDSTGTAALLKCQRTAAEHGVELSIANASPIVERVLRLSGVAHLLGLSAKPN